MPLSLEDRTLDRVLEGGSLARFGDGEYMILDGDDARMQPYHRDLAEELNDILEDSPCLVAGPQPYGPRGEYWSEFLDGRELLEWSSFISRPDEAPWIDRQDYWAKVESLWKDRDVTLVRGGGSLTAEMLASAKSVREIVCPEYDAWRSIDIDVGEPEIVILCLGAAATVLADRLSRQGHWAVDAGSIGCLENIRELA